MLIRLTVNMLLVVLPSNDIRYDGATKGLSSAAAYLIRTTQAAVGSHSPEALDHIHSSTYRVQVEGSSNTRKRASISRIYL